MPGRMTEGYAVYELVIEYPDGEPEQNHVVVSDCHMTEASAEAWKAEHEDEHEGPLTVAETCWYDP